MPTKPYKMNIVKSGVSPRLLEIMDNQLVEGKLTRVPGTTTIISRFKDAGGLIHWAWTEGAEGRDYRDTRDEAAGAGTLAHEMVERDIRGLPPLKHPSRENETDDEWEKLLVKWVRANSSFDAYREWKEQTNLRPLLTELPLMSKRWLFGGTIDAVILNDKVALLDWKTSNGIYQDHIIQLGGGYAILWEENYPDKPIDGGFHMLRFSKEEGDFTHHAWQNLELAKRQFMNFRESYEVDKLLKKRL